MVNETLGCVFVDQGLDILFAIDVAVDLVGGLSVNALFDVRCGEESSTGYLNPVT